MPANTPQLDDGILLAWIEGELSPDRHRAVTRALAEAPALQARVDAMRLDRFTLSALGDEKAPAGLLDGVADLLEREMLIGGPDALSDALDDQDQDPWSEPDLDLPNHVETRPVIARVRPPRRISDFQIAMAAGLLLVVGASAWIGGMMFAGRGSALPDPNRASIAHNTETDPAASELADAATLNDPAEMRAETRRPTADLPSAAQPQAHALAPSNQPITPDRAAQLLAENRLVLRVRMADLSGLAWLDQIADRVAIDRDIPAELAAALEPANTPLPDPATRPTLLAMEGAPLVGPPVSLRTEAPSLPERVVASIVRIEMTADARTLDAALRALRTQPAIASAEFEDAGHPLPTADDPTTEDILWWRKPPNQWTPKAKVPVVFEVLR